MEAVTAAEQVRKLAAQAVVNVSTKRIDAQSAAMLTAADAETRGAVLAQQVATIKRTFLRAVEMAYEETPGGVRLGHFDDGRLRSSVPWSVRSYRKFHIGFTTSSLLRMLLLNWENGFWLPTGALPVPPPVFLGNGRAWFLNTKAYPTKLSVVSATLLWPTLDYVAYLEKFSSLQASKARAKYRKGKDKAKGAR